MMQTIARLCAALPVLLGGWSATAQPYPNKPITLVVPYAAGGPTDVTARQLGDHMSRTLGQPFIVENVAGAGGSTGSGRVAKAAPDGYTLLVHQLGLAITPALYPAAVRTTGMGWAIGVGRLGAILAPLLAGVLVDGGWQAGQLYYLYAIPLAVAMLAVRGLRVR